MYDQWGTVKSGTRGSWKCPLTVTGILSLTTLILGMVAAGIGNSNGRRIRVLLEEVKQKTPDDVCAFGDVLFGEEVHNGTFASSSGNMTYYQVCLAKMRSCRGFALFYYASCQPFLGFCVAFARIHRPFATTQK